MTEIDRRLQGRSDRFVLHKLFAIVDGDGMHPVNERSQQGNRGILHFGSRLSFELMQEGEL